MKNEEEILTLLSLMNRHILIRCLDSDIRKRIMESLKEAHESITFVDKKDYYKTIERRKAFKGQFGGY